MMMWESGCGQRHSAGQLPADRATMGLRVYGAIRRAHKAGMCGLKERTQPAWAAAARLAVERDGRVGRVT